MEKEKEPISKKVILDEIKYMKSGSREELSMFFTESILTYLRTILAFGLKYKNAGECFNVYSDMKKILKKEKELFKIIAENIDKIELNEAQKIIDMLDELNDDTYLAYDNILYQIYLACNDKDENRIIKSNKPINSLLNNNKYENEVLKLVKKNAK